MKSQFYLDVLLSPGIDFNIQIEWHDWAWGTVPWAQYCVTVVRIFEWSKNKMAFVVLFDEQAQQNKKQHQLLNRFNICHETFSQFEMLFSFTFYFI